MLMKINKFLDKKRKKLYSISCIVVIFDQLIKWIVASNMELYQEINVIDNFFSLYYLKNYGAAFSMLEGMTSLFIIIGIVALIYLDRFIHEEKLGKWPLVLLGIIIGGIVGNLIDRIFYGGVIDYLSFDIMSYSFPVFNMADIAIVVGIVIFIIIMIWSDISEKVKNK